MDFGLRSKRAQYRILKGERERQRNVDGILPPPRPRVFGLQCCTDFRLTDGGGGERGALENGTGAQSNDLQVPRVCLFNTQQN